MKYITILWLLIFGIHANEPRAKSDAATHMAYAVVVSKPKDEPKPEPKPEPGSETLACECQDECKCVGDCKCVGCKLDGNCCKCARPQEAPVEWKWFDGEYRKMQGEKVLEIRKYKKVAIQSCNGRRCVITGYQWVPIK